MKPIEEHRLLITRVPIEFGNNQVAGFNHSAAGFGVTNLVVGQQVFVAGMTARAGDIVQGGDSMYEQAKATFTKITHLLEAAGARIDDVVKVNIFVTDIKRREEVWKARREFFTGDFPVSTLVEVRALAAPELLVEIEAEALARGERHLAIGEPANAQLRSLQIHEHADRPVLIARCTKGRLFQLPGHVFGPPAEIFQQDVLEPKHSLHPLRKNNGQ